MAKMVVATSPGFARYGLLDDYIAEMQSTLVRGIAVRARQSSSTNGIVPPSGATR